MKILYIYLLVMNLIAFILMAVDKVRAVRHRWRIQERTLFIPAILGGALGALLGMLLLWHKTRNKMFVIGMPCLFILQLVILLLVR